MPKIQYQIALSGDEVQLLERIVSSGTENAEVIRRAHSLLLSHQKQQAQDIARFLEVNPNTVSVTRRRYHEVRLPAALYEKAGQVLNGVWTGNKKRSSSRWRAVTHRTVLSTGQCSCWQTNWWS